ncbi:MAG: (Fe-S)-binding protein [Desulfatitalea sp.]|nr:(Fe-S)-binding protein [Desulfatitalea sp.]NNK01206.1 (Fe-S)-binding protein [Desulfatitalea sp.]
MSSTTQSRAVLATGAVSRLVGERGNETFRKCMQCGTCSALCPWTDIPGHPFNIRRLIQQVAFGDEGFEHDDILYACTTCRLCESMCPRGVELVDFVRTMRQLVTQTGFYPNAYREVIYSLRTFGNPWSQKRENRLSWKKDLRIPTYKKGTDYLLFGCCTNAFDPDRQRSLYAFARLLQQAGVSFGILGKEETCCGESIRKIGAQEDFTALAQHNTDIFLEKGVETIITLSPHCHHIFKTAYPDLAAQVKIIHYTEMLETLLADGRLTPREQPPINVSYHDPCYLGRHTGIYDAPRNIIHHIQGVQLVELRKNKKYSQCCGGGGGRIWMGGDSGKLANVRVRDAMDKEAETLLTACPYCTSMLDYSATVLGGQIRVMDLAEYVATCV